MEISDYFVQTVSGMFIVTCALDRKIRIFDFFSGDVIAEVVAEANHLIN